MSSRPTPNTEATPSEAEIRAFLDDPRPFDVDGNMGYEFVGVDEWVECATAAMEHLLARNERYREALERVMAIIDDADDLAYITARQALQEQSDG